MKMGFLFKITQFHTQQTQWLKNQPPDVRNINTVLSCVWVGFICVMPPMVFQIRTYYMYVCVWVLYAPIATFCIRIFLERYIQNGGMYASAINNALFFTGTHFYNPNRKSLSQFMYDMATPVVPWYQHDVYDNNTGRCKSGVPKVITVRILYWMIRYAHRPHTARAIFKYHIAATGRGRWTRTGDLVQAYLELLNTRAALEKPLDK